VYQYNSTDSLAVVEWEVAYDLTAGVTGKTESGAVEHTHALQTYLNIISAGDIQPKTNPKPIPSPTLYDPGIPDPANPTNHTRATK